MTYAKILTIALCVFLISVSGYWFLKLCDHWDTVDAAKSQDKNARAVTAWVEDVNSKTRQGSRIIGLELCSGSSGQFWKISLATPISNSTGELYEYRFISDLWASVRSGLSPEQSVVVKWDEASKKCLITIHSLSEISSEFKVWELKEVPQPRRPKPAEEDPPVRVYEYGDPQPQENGIPPPINNKSKVD